MLNSPLTNEEKGILCKNIVVYIWMLLTNSQMSGMNNKQKLQMRKLDLFKLLGLRPKVYATPAAKTLPLMVLRDTVPSEVTKSITVKLPGTAI